MQVDINAKLQTFQAEKYGNEGIIRRGDVHLLQTDGYMFEETANGKVDVMILSAPCQDFSSLNAAKAGVEGENGCVLNAALNALFPAKASNSLPRLILIENVKGIAYKSNVSGASPPLLTAIDTLYALGYDAVAYRKIDSTEFGVPMHRERIFLVASLSKDPGAAHSIPGGLAAEVLFAKDVIQPCGGCPEGGKQCFQCWKTGHDARETNADCTYIKQMHCAISEAKEEILSTILTSTGKVIVSTPSGDVGIIREDQKLSVFSLPVGFMDAIESKTDRDMALGNCIQLDCAVWLLSRILVCWDTELENQTAVVELMNDRGRCESIDNVVAGFGSTSWRNGINSGTSTGSNKHTMPMYAIFLRGVGSFKVSNIPPCPSPSAFRRIGDVIDLTKLDRVEVSELHALIARMGLRGIILDAELLSRFILYARKKKQGLRLIPPVCQLVLADAMLLPPMTGLVYIAPLDQLWPVELHTDDSLRKYGRTGLPVEPLRAGEVWALIPPLNNSMGSKTGNLLLPREWWSYFRVKLKDVYLYGSVGQYRRLYVLEMHTLLTLLLLAALENSVFCGRRCLMMHIIG